MILVAAITVAATHAAEYRAQSATVSNELWILVPVGTLANCREPWPFIIETVMAPIDSNPQKLKIPPFPTLSILAIVVIPLLASLSWPYWSWSVDRQIKNPSSYTNYAPDPGQFGGIAIVAAVVMTGAFAALVGLLIAWFAGRRKERWRGLRIFAWVINGAGAAIGLALLIEYALKTAM